MNGQLTLPIALNDEATFSNYLPGANAIWLSYLQQFIIGNHGRYLFLWGDAGAGRSHLLQACCHSSLDRGDSVAYLNFHPSFKLQPAVLENLEHSHLVCLDDIQHIVGISEWEEALFHSYNRFNERGTLFIVSASAPVHHLNIELADLASRLSSSVSIHLHALTDEQKLQALHLRARQRGFSLSQDVGQFLLRRYPRDMSALFAAFEQLDQASLAAKRKITIPFAKQVLVI